MGEFRIKFDSIPQCFAHLQITLGRYSDTEVIYKCGNKIFSIIRQADRFSAAVIDIQTPLYDSPNSLRYFIGITANSD